MVRGPRAPSGPGKGTCTASWRPLVLSRAFQAYAHHSKRAVPLLDGCSLPSRLHSIPECLIVHYCPRSITSSRQHCRTQTARQSIGRSLPESDPFPATARPVSLMGVRLTKTNAPAISLVFDLQHIPKSLRWEDQQQLHTLTACRCTWRLILTISSATLQDL